MSAIPMFDPDSDDAMTLDSLEKARSMRSASYRTGAHSDEDIALIHEGVVHGNFSTTIPGIAARLQLAIISSDQSAYVEETLLCRGWKPLVDDAYAGALDGNTCELVKVLDELIRLDWEQKIEAYERATMYFDRVIAAQDAIDRILRELDADGIDTGDDFDPLIAMFNGDDEVRALIKTLSPDLAAFNRKGEIVAAEDLHKEAWPWMLRDARFLMGNLDADPSLPKKEAA